MVVTDILLDFYDALIQPDVYVPVSLTFSLAFLLKWWSANSQIHRNCIVSSVNSFVHGPCPWFGSYTSTCPRDEHSFGGLLTAVLLEAEVFMGICSAFAVEKIRLHSCVQPVRRRYIGTRAPREKHCEGHVSMKELSMLILKLKAMLCQCTRMQPHSSMSGQGTFCRCLPPNLRLRPNCEAGQTS